MDFDVPELKAMAGIAELFASLEEEEVRRVLRWATEKYRFAPSAPPSGGLASPASSAPAAQGGTYADLPAFFDAARPADGLERILAAAYFHQVVSGEADFDSQGLNTQLKHMGYPSSNITRDMARLVDRSPKLVIQTRKEGTSQQARKRFRLTTEGVRAVEDMLRRVSQ